MVLSLLFPLLEIDLALYETVPIQAYILSNNPVENIVQGSSSLPITSISQAFGYLYVSVALAKLLIFGVGIYLVFRKIKRAKVQSFRGIKVYVFPYFNPSSIFNKILMPAFDLKSTGHQQILLHESEHVRQGHSWDLLFLHFVKSLLWINPFVYLVELSLREVHEYQADNKVIHTNSPKIYGKILVNNLIQNKHNLVINSFNQFQIKNRIIMMNKCKSTNLEKWRYFMSVPLLILMLGLFSMNTAEQSKNVIGTWVGSDFEFTLEEGPYLKALVEGGEKLHMDGKLILNENKTYRILDATQTMNGKGNWNYEGQNLVLNDQDGNKEEYLIEEVTNTRLVTVHKVSMDTPEGKIEGKIRLTYLKE
tara:strand:- start:12549 stop:13640 length:1092 start_codon:yes stop_codon:yes gene_type:complete